MPLNPYQFTAKEREYRARLEVRPSLKVHRAPLLEAVCHDGHAGLSWHTYHVPSPVGAVNVLWCDTCGGEA